MRSARSHLTRGGWAASLVGLTIRWVRGEWIDMDHLIGHVVFWVGDWVPYYFW
jgi:hypothetical protein